MIWKHFDNLRKLWRFDAWAEGPPPLFTHLDKYSMPPAQCQEHSLFSQEMYNFTIA